MRLAEASAVFLMFTSAAVSQTILPGVGRSVHIVNEDMAILESQIPRKDLPCEVKAVNPTLGFDLRFHAGYDILIPLKGLAGDGNVLKMLFRVAPAADPESPVYFQDSVNVPSIEENAGGQSVVGGSFDVGEGKYHVDFIVRDQQDRICAYFWDGTAELPSRDRDLKLAIAANTVEAAKANHFEADPPVQRGSPPLLSVKVLVNFAPQNQNSSVLQPEDTLALVTMMRRISQSPRVGKFSVVAFNIQEQRVLYRQMSADRIDFPEMGKAIEKVSPGLLDARLLANKRGEVEFLTDLVRTEMADSDQPDALIFAGPKYMVAAGSPEDELKSIEGAGYPLFYLNYNLSPQTMSWRDSIGRVVRLFGGKEYTITRPRDLFFAVTEVMDRIVESKEGRTSPVSPQ